MFFDGINMEFVGFDMQENCQVIITLGNQILQNEMFPLAFARQQLMITVQQFARDNRPLQIKCIRDYETESGRILKNMLVFSNNAYIRAFGDKI